MKGERNCCLSLLLRGSPVISPCDVEFAAQPAPDPMEWLYSLHQIWQPTSLEKHLQGSDCKQRGCLHCKWITNVGQGRGTFYCGTCFLHATDGLKLGLKGFCTWAQRILLCHRGRGTCFTCEVSPLYELKLWDLTSMRIPICPGLR